jgi:hypothetical protein
MRQRSEIAIERRRWLHASGHESDDERDNAGDSISTHADSRRCGGMTVRRVEDHHPPLQNMQGKQLDR